MVAGQRPAPIGCVHSLQSFVNMYQECTIVKLCPSTSTQGLNLQCPNVLAYLILVSIPHHQFGLLGKQGYCSVWQYGNGILSTIQCKKVPYLEKYIYSVHIMMYTLEKYNYIGK